MSIDKFEPYPRYRRTEGWLERVPDHWTTTSLGKVTLDKCDGPFGSGLKSEHYTDAGIQVVRLQNIKLDGFRTGEPVYIDAEHYNRNLSDHSVVTGDVLIAGLGDPRNPVGRACVAPPGIEPAMVKADCFRFRLDQRKVHSEFVALQLSASSWFASGTMATGSTRARIPLSSMAKRPLTYCPQEEQTQIAKFLDCETAKIDALIEKQQQLIVLLKEKRQAVISHAVTKGLNPDAPMRDSGVEWLGEVPGHWRIGQLRRWVGGMEQGRSPECESRPAEADEWGVLKTGCVNGGRYDDCENKALPPHLSPATKYEVQVGDVLMSRASGSTELIGSVAFVETTRPRILLSDKIFRLHFDANMDSRYFRDLMASSYMRSSIVRAISGADGMANNITKSAVLGFQCALPSIDEQRSIVLHIDEATSRISGLTHRAHLMLAILEERRTALISAAVTGKIDVRGWQAPEAKTKAEVA